MKNCYFYATHVAIEGRNPCHFFAALLELVVDRSRGFSRQGQWVQHLEGTIINGVYIHAVTLEEMRLQRGKSEPRFSLRNTDLRALCKTWPKSDADTFEVTDTWQDREAQDKELKEEIYADHLSENYLDSADTSGAASSSWQQMD